MLEVRCKNEYCRETMVYEKFRDHHHHAKCIRPECSERDIAYDKMTEEHLSLMTRFNAISTELRDVRKILENQKIRNGQLSMEKQTLEKKIDNQRKNNKVAHDSYEKLRKKHADIEVRNDLMMDKVQYNITICEKLKTENTELDIENGLMKKKVESYEKLKTSIKESDILSE